jgi:hypothetical protein
MLQKDLLQEAKEVIAKGDRQLLGYVAAAEKLQLGKLKEELVRHLQQQEVWLRLCSTGQVRGDGGGPCFLGTELAVTFVCRVKAVGNVLHEFA